MSHTKHTEKDTDDSFSESDLDGIRTKTFNPELSRLIDRVTGNESDQTAEATDDAQNEQDNPVRRLNSLIYGQYARRFAGSVISEPLQSSPSYTLLEYELQRLGIDHYALYTYSEEMECFHSVRSVHVDIPSIGMYNDALFDAVNQRWGVFDGYYLISLVSLLGVARNFFSQRILPLIMVESGEWDELLYCRIVSNETIISTLLTLAYQQQKTVDHVTVLFDQIHTELIRLQHNYVLVPGSVCYIITTDQSGSEDSIEQFVSAIHSIDTILTSLSALYFFNQTTAVFFLLEDDIHTVHNHFLSMREKNSNALLYDLGNFNGRGFLESIYRIACKRKVLP